MGCKQALLSVVLVVLAGHQAYAEGNNIDLNTLTSRELTKRAAAFEQTGAPLQAAHVYEALIQRKPARSRILAPRLAKIYAESGQTNQALTWAEQVIPRQPDPIAYRAGIHTMLRDYKTATTLLNTELAGTNTLHRTIQLHWQLADTQQKSGNTRSALTTLKKATSMAQGTPHEAAARQREAIFRKPCIPDFRAICSERDAGITRAGFFRKFSLGVLVSVR